MLIGYYGQSVVAGGLGEGQAARRHGELWRKKTRVDLPTKFSCTNGRAAILQEMPDAAGRFGKS